MARLFHMFSFCFFFFLLAASRSGIEISSIQHLLTIFYVDTVLVAFLKPELHVAWSETYFFAVCYLFMLVKSMGCLFAFI